MLISVLYFHCIQATGQELSSVSICYDPPPTMLRNDPNVLRATFFNYIVAESFAQIGVQVKYDLQHTFKACMDLVKNGQVDFLQGAYYDTERAKNFDYSDHYNTLTPQVFYRKDQPIKITQVSDLKRYKGCGIYGSTYAQYALSEKDLDLGPGYKSMFNKLLAKRCDYFVEELEVLYEMGAAGTEFLDNPMISHTGVPGALPPSRYLITMKNGKASALLPKFNKALSQVIESAGAKEFWTRENGERAYQR